MIRAVVSRLCNHVKHYVLDAAHPYPTFLEVYPGKLGTLEYVMVETVLNHTDVPNVLLRDEGPEVTVWVDGDPTAGWLAVCRYFGRHWKLYPVTPESALRVDSSLDRLVLFVHPMIHETAVEMAVVQERVRTAFEYMEGRLSTNQYLEEFQDPTLADLLWFAAITYTIQSTVSITCGSEFPRVCDWWMRMYDRLGLESPAEDAGEESKEESDEESKEETKEDETTNSNEEKETVGNKKED